MDIWHMVLSFGSAILGLLLSIFGFFLGRYIRQIDTKIEAHEKVIAEHTVKIETIITTHTLQYTEIIKRLDMIFEKFDKYDNNINEFYKNYELKKKNE